ncbi:hypothetical protein [Paenibacillus kandeliae]|uniref:hypothetical protein n=1 Tax=Paenibacillus kandeliae TaxID=3231269 RepID=UPI003458A05C
MLANHIGQLLEIVYLDQTGKLSQRRIEIRHIRNGLVYADCLRSGEPRTFKQENILAWQPSKAIRPTISVKELAAQSANQMTKEVASATASSSPVTHAHRSTTTKPNDKRTMFTSHFSTNTRHRPSHSKTNSYSRTSPTTRRSSTMSKMKQTTTEPSPVSHIS